tara:strand:+ start:108122 stop:111109 length:2988 start_codon:yes stop_codon:yes gene_type:complete
MKMRQTLFKSVFLLLFFAIPIVVFSQGTITGNVTEAGNGLPLPAANIVVKGTTNGTTTDFDGNFEIEVSNFPAVLVFSSLGYASLESEVNGPTTLNVSLQESATGLEEVVVTGLATSVKRSNAANAVASVSAEELAGVTPPQTLDGALQGKFAGAIITKSSGAPGGGISVKLRGVTSVNGNAQPLYIVDGVYMNNSSIFAPGLNDVSGAASGGARPSSNETQDNPSNRIADLNPDDIEKVEILKGASAAAIYGARAAAGVVLITTKKGKAGRTKISFTQDVGFNEIIKFRGQRNYTAAIAESGFGAGQGALFTAAQNSGELIDYEEEIFGEEGFINNTSVNVSGGSDSTLFYAGFSNNEEEGIVKNSGYNKKSIRLNVDHRFFKDKAKLSLTTNYINSSSNRGFFNNDNTGATIGVSLTSTPPWARLYPDDNGNYPDNPYGASNPLQTRDLITNNESVNRFLIGATLDLSLLQRERSSLKLILRGGVDYFDLVTTAIFPKELQFQKLSNGGLNGLTAQGATQNKDANYSAFLVHNLYLENNLSFTTQAGITKQSFSQNTVRNTSSNLIGTETNVDQAANVAVSQYRLEQEDTGFFVQEEVNFQDKLIGTIGVRGDKSSNNGDANKIFYYPKASAAANFHNFWDLGAFSQLKLRGAYGEAGNFAPFGALFTGYVNSLIDGQVGIVVPTTLGDPSIKPERQKELEIGFDAGLLENRLSLEFSYYIKSVDDLVLEADNAQSSGYTLRWSNAGNLQNKGVELSLNANVFENPSFSWDTGVIFYRNKSEITKLNINPFDVGGFGTGLGTFRIEEGKSVTQIVGNDADGNLVVLGDAEPDFQMTFTNNLRYKDFNLSFLWHWKKGGDNINLSNLLFDFGQTSHDYDDVTLDPAGVLSNGDYRISAFRGGFAAPFVEDASYLRLREIGLFYTVPSNCLEKTFGGHVSNIKVGISGNNLINIFDYNSYDPEVSNFGSNALSTGVEVTPFPSSKRYMFHLSVDF